MRSNRADLAIVLSGGGARAAYQVGFLRFLATQFPDLSPDILTGVSAGAVNAAYLAARVRSFRDTIAELSCIWSELRLEQVFRVGFPNLASHIARWGLRLASGGSRSAPLARSMVDTQPLRELLTRMLGAEDGVLTGIDRNLRNRALTAVAITASSYSTGQSITWVQGQEIALWERAHRKSVKGPLTVEHVMASSALPLLFPAVQVDGAWYGDGGIRLTAPLSPAIHLGANRILAISTRYARTREEADRPVVNGYPPAAQVAGVLLNAIFLDLLDNDALRVERINQLIEELPEEKRRTMRHVDLLVLRPSRDLGRLAYDYEPQLPRAFRFLTRGLGTRETRSNDLLSLLMFQPDYLKHLLALGEADARSRQSEIADFLRLC